MSNAIAHRIGLALLLILLCAPCGAEPGTPVTCISAADGDDLWVEDAQGLRVRVRLLGIDAWEWNEEGGPEAKAFLQSLCERYPTMYLEEDPKADYCDRWGRNLRWVWTSDSQLVQRLLLDAGHARPFMVDTTAHPERVAPQDIP